MLVEGKKFVFLGGATGIGKAAAIISAREGASVVTMSTAKPEDERAVSVISECEKVGNGKYKHIQVNAADRDSVFRAVNEAAEFLGGIDGICLSQGVFTPELLMNVTRESVMEDFDIAVFGSLYGVQAAYPHLKAAGGGSVILFGASAMVQGLVNYGAYNIAKGAIIGMQRTLASELATDYIRVNVVQPMVYTEISDKFRAIATPEELAVAFESLKTIKMGPPEVQGWERHGKASQAGDLVVYLLSDMSNFITGQIINVDGGANFSHT